MSEHNGMKDVPLGRIYTVGERQYILVPGYFYGS